MADDFDVEAMLEAPYRKVGFRTNPLKACVTVYILFPSVVATVT